MTTLVEWSQGGRNSRRRARALVVAEGVLLALVAPLLLFPERFPVAAAGGLMALALMWLVSLVALGFPVTPFNLALLLWGAALVVGILVSADPAETLPKATGLVLGLAVWRYAVLAITSRRHVALAVGLWLLLGLGFAFIGIIGLQELPKIPALAALNPLQAVVLPQAVAMAVHPNQLAALISLILPALYSLALGERALRPVWRVACGGAALAVTAILVFTQSRGGWIAAATGLYALLMLWAVVLPPSRARRWLRLAAGAAVLLVLAVVLWIGPGTLRDLWLNPPAETVVGTLSTLNYRRELWPWALTAIGDFPLSGVGLGAFREVAFRLYPLPLQSWQDIGHAHNIFLQTALDIGLTGLVVYVALLLLAAAVGWRVARRDAGFRAVALGLLAGLAALHIFGLADALALGSKPGLLFWFALGLLAAMNREGMIS